MRRYTVGPVWYWLFVAILAAGVWALVIVVLYLNPVIPLWDYFMPPPDQPEGPAELRMWYFSVSVATVATLVFVLTAAARRLLIR